MGAGYDTPSISSGRHAWDAGSEFWWWILLTLVVTAALQSISYDLSGFFSIATFLPSIAVTARPLHDTDRSGWWQLLYFLPVVGWIILIVFCAEAGKPNRYSGGGSG
jgi:uncharacterized membrane protein YhaH (DUF805 family)